MSHIESDVITRATDNEIQHLQSCKRCRTRIDTDVDLGSVRDRLLSEATTEPRSVTPSLRRSFRPWLVGIGAAALVLALFVPMLLLDNQPVDDEVVNPPGTTLADVVRSTTTPTRVSPTVDEPSQSPADAERDGVVPALAALSADLRVDPVFSVPTEEGLWVLSRPSRETWDLAPGCALGDRNGLYGRDGICVVEYGEVLLMDPSGEEILRAYPLPGLPPRQLVVTDEAVFCGRQGDGALPDSMLCRIDRATLNWTVRVFPFDAASMFVDRVEIYIPDNWTVEDPSDTVYFERMAITDAGLTVEGSDGTRLVDPHTLELEEPPG